MRSPNVHSKLSPADWLPVFENPHTQSWVVSVILMDGIVYFSGPLLGDQGVPQPARSLFPAPDPLPPSTSFIITCFSAGRWAVDGTDFWLSGV